MSIRFWKEPAEVGPRGGCTLFFGLILGVSVIGGIIAATIGSLVH